MGMGMMDELHNKLREWQWRSEKKMTPQAEAQYESLMMAKAGWDALTTWLEMPPSAHLSAHGLRLASVGLAMASDNGFKESSLTACALMALRQDKAQALGWLCDQGFDPREAPAPRLDRGGFYAGSRGRYEKDASGWLASAAQISAFECARLMADRGFFLPPPAPEPKPVDAVDPGEAVEAPAKKKSSAKLKKELAMMARFEELVIMRQGESWLDHEADSLRESHPLLALLGGRLELAPAGVEYELLEPRFGLGLNPADPAAQPPALRLAMARMAADGEPRAIAMAAHFGVAPDEGGELAAKALTQCAKHLSWAASGSHEDKKTAREARASVAKMTEWLKASGALGRMEAAGRPFADYALDEMMESAEDCFASRSEESAARAFGGIRRKFKGLILREGLKGKESLGAPSEAGLKAAREKLTEFLLDDRSPRLSRPEDKKNYANLRGMAEQWIAEISALIEPEPTRRKVLKV